MVSSIKNIVVIGDSHLAGAELKLEKESVWTSIVGKKTGLGVKNFSKGATSNERNMRLLPEILLGSKDCLVIYGLTSWLRSEIFSQKTYYPVGINFAKLLEKNLGQIQSHHKKLNDVYIDNLLQSSIDEMSDNNYRILNHLIYVESLCKRFANDYLFFPTMTGLIPHDIKKQKVILQALDTNKIIKFGNHNNWHDWCASHSFAQGALGNFLEEAHEKFADLFIKNYLN